jgi:hypothetical protein
MSLLVCRVFGRCTRPMCRLSRGFGDCCVAGEYCDVLCLRSEDAFVVTCVANFMEVKVLYVQQDLRYEISSYWRFNV